MTTNPNERMNDQYRLLVDLGIGFPETEDQMRTFDRVHENYQFESKVDKIDPQKMLNRLAQEQKVKAGKIDFHKRTVLGAEIVHRLIRDKFLGHVKLEKLVYLCQNMANMEVHATFAKHAMGPYDPHLIRSLDSQFTKRQWFLYDGNSIPKYKPLEKAGEHKKWFEIYYGHNKTDFDFIINTFYNFKMEQIELVVTIYDCWKKIIDDKENLTTSLIAEKVYSWSPNKSKFKIEQIENAMTWMKEKGVYPKTPLH